MKLLIVQPTDTELSIPLGGLLLWAGVSAPSGWSFDTDFDDCFVMGGTALDIILQGAVSHAHTQPGMASGGAHSNHSVTVAGSGSAGSSDVLSFNNKNTILASHTHTGTGSGVSSSGAHTHTSPITDSDSNLPPYVRMRWIGGSEIVPVGGIAMRSVLAGLPEGWLVCDGTNGTPDMRSMFVYGGTGANGGANSHNHASSGATASGGDHTHNGINIVSNTVSGTLITSSYNPMNNVSDTHNHTASNLTSNTSAAHTHTISDTSNDSVLPPYVTVYYIMRME